MAAREAKWPNGSGHGGPPGLGTASLTFFLSHMVFMSGTSSTCVDLPAPKVPDSQANLSRPGTIALTAVPPPPQVTQKIPKDCQTHEGLVCFSVS